ncbi:MAG: aminoacyl-tRNA hydrolase [Planctomycetota bacterium]|nr:aminoacyl-tRNA hydrolase [Planctomycetaceae bacterium]MDQ3331909.1 aminoacyl-tRNA hydrolase [Planctomycetota bacterium]
MTTSPPDETHLVVSRTVAIPLAEFDVEYVRSGGPGGQNVNKVSSKARVRWPVSSSPSLPEEMKERFLTRYKSRLTNEGELVVAGQRYRDQKKNLDDCLQRIVEMIREVLVPPRPRKATKPTRGSQRRRVETKRQRSDTKRLRGKPKDAE